MLADLRYALRTFARSPALVAAAVVCLALGIGANATIFGVVDTLLFRPPPQVQDPERIVPLLSQTPSSFRHEHVKHHRVSAVHTDPGISAVLRRARSIHLLPEGEPGARRGRSPRTRGAGLGELFPAARGAAGAGAVLLGGRRPSRRPRGRRAGLRILARVLPERFRDPRATAPARA